MIRQREGTEMSKVVTSPAGEEIKVTSDEHWIKATNTRQASITMWDAKRPVLGALWTHGKYEHPSGAATSLLHDDALALGYTGMPVSLNGMVISPTVQPAIERDINGKRTYRIQLVALPQSWYERLDAEWPRTNGHATVADVPAVVPVPLPAITAHEAKAIAASAPMVDDVPTLEELPTPDYEPPIELTVTNAVAQALLTQVVEIISAGTRSDATGKIRTLETELRLSQESLAKRLDENDKLRRMNNKINEELQMNKSRVATLGQQLRTAEYNLRQATSQDTQRFINEQVQKELAKIMQAKPNEKA